MTVYKLSYLKTQIDPSLDDDIILWLPIQKQPVLTLPPIINYGEKYGSKVYKIICCGTVID